MKVRILLFFIALFSGTSLFAQNVLDGVYVKEHTVTRRVIPYPYLREADVMWSKRIWRVIDLNEKINLPLKYPLSKATSDRKSLIDLCLDAIKEGSLTAYNATDDEFTSPITMKEIEARGGAKSDTVRMQRPDPPYDEYDTIVAREFDPDKVISYRVKEDWFFDKQRSVMDVRIIGFAPMIFAVDEFGNVREGNIKTPLFWIYYPEARKLLANAEAFNRENDAERRSFDDIFQKRMFSSYIFKEANVYDRRIEDYRQGIAQLYESERIKEEITNFEHDLWEF
ncbi:MAG: gliding motility protein GldN [Bacteroidetes bacterium]|nr:MAG: gliding motility protein GldN [Bacteroidota bacterium]REK03514.1 MAG: gliding motility protein GldN [Bacteroidota bacterium]REK34819.1 MAG: gliding motility protein GldN [Bacteroidota bacterium]REK51301.1 MAG: gliding motility protein GldN [Bacteroidota bacterium]